MTKTLAPKMSLTELCAELQSLQRLRPLLTFHDAVKRRECGERAGGPFSVLPNTHLSVLPVRLGLETAGGAVGAGRDGLASASAVRFCSAAICFRVALFSAIAAACGSMPSVLLLNS